ncbi:putative Thiosulfate sulfurtransferase [Capnocytophaga canimorsus]|uniref:Putative Thiosulfate sulfurtransferase n=1 Tax=Capnocytophaga canimorsus TaxID=28188 RepID=A0A0B7IRY4_9FLAO|nr:rhodanese-like domain-containing protein [Capnocytophaga canimorsus]CEN53384.1 putative Thiosulfate sulfurtransferase [Capnocytophaga canimorsus]
MKYIIAKNKWILLGIILGAIAGYLYYHYVGCLSGTCAITSKPINSTLYGVVLGGLLFSMFKNKKKDTMNLKEIATDALIVDVRTPEEFNQGHFQGSINIPLQEIAQRADEIKNSQKPVILLSLWGKKRTGNNVFSKPRA